MTVSHLRIHRFHIHGFKQPQMENIPKKVQPARHGGAHTQEAEAEFEASLG